jgi:hypothetical protein
MLFSIGEPTSYALPRASRDHDVVQIECCPNNRFVAVLTSSVVYVFSAGLVSRRRTDRSSERSSSHRCLASFFRIFAQHRALLGQSVVVDESEILWRVMWNTTSSRVAVLVRLQTSAIRLLRLTAERQTLSDTILFYDIESNGGEC